MKIDSRCGWPSGKTLLRAFSQGRHPDAGSGIEALVRLRDDEA